MESKTDNSRLNIDTVDALTVVVVISRIPVLSGVAHDHYVNQLEIP